MFEKLKHLVLEKEVIVDPITGHKASLNIYISKMIVDMEQGKVFIIPSFVYKDKDEKLYKVPSNSQTIMALWFNEIETTPIEELLNTFVEKLQTHLVEANMFGIENPEELKIETNGNITI